MLVLRIPWRHGLLAVVLLAVFALSLSGLWGCSDSDTVTPDGPLLALSSNNLAFSSFAGLAANPAQRKVVVSNVGSGYLTFTATTSAAWLELGPTGNDTIYVTARPETLSPGIYQDSIVVTSTQALNSPLVIQVSLAVLERIATTPNDVNFTAITATTAPAPQRVELLAAGGNVIGFDAATQAPWLSVAPQSGTVPDTLVLTADITGLLGGEYADSIVVTSSDVPSFRSVIRVRLRMDSWERTWIVADSLSSHVYALRDIDIYGPTQLHIAGILPLIDGPRAVFLGTPDAGATWSPRMLSGPAGKYTAIEFLSPTTGWMVGDSARLLVTTNGGADWRQADGLPVADSVGLIDITFVGTDSAWIAAEKGQVLFTSTSGALWINQPTPTSFGLRKVWFISPTQGWICGNHGTILTTINGGDTWTALPSGVVDDLQGITFIDQNHGWAVGAGGIVLYTSDGGANWSEQTSGVSEVLTDVTFVDGNRGWAVGFQGTVLGTVDGGQTWVRQPTHVTYDLYGVEYYDSESAYIVGNGGLLLRTYNGGR